MKPLRHGHRFAGAVLLASVSCVVWAKPGVVPVDKVERVVTAVTAATRSQDKVDKAQQQVEKVQQRVDATQQRVQDAQRGVERAVQQSTAAARAGTAQERAEAAGQRLTGQERAADRAAAAESQAARASGRSDQADRAAGRSDQTDRANARAELASGGRAGGDPPSHAQKPADAGDPDDPGKPDRAKKKKGKERGSNNSSRRSERADERARGPKDENQAAASNQALADAQMRRFTQLLSAWPRVLEMTRLGLAVRGEVVGIELSPAAIAAARRAGFTIVSQELIEGLEMRFVTLRTPRGMSVDAALAQLARIAPRSQFVPNNIYIQSGDMAGAPSVARAALAQGRVAGPAYLGIIDGGVARHPSLRGPVEQRGFVRGAPAANGHATAVASLAVGAGRLKGAAPGDALLVADVYGQDPAGGNAMTLVRALGWMLTRRVPVVAMPLAGPPNPVVASAIMRARQRGTYIIAPVGNGGPASPAAYPAAYPTVIAVTGVDRRNRILIEAGRGPRIDYVAPAADMVAATIAGGQMPVRGTSFAVPLVAGRLSVVGRGNAQPIAALDREAADLGAPGPDGVYGRGLVCAKCRNK